MSANTEQTYRNPDEVAKVIRFAIEHLEPKLSEWLLIEYSHAVRIAGRGRVVITNVKKPAERRKLQRFVRVESRGVAELFPRSRLLVLDPRARKSLCPTDVGEDTVMVVGGILGDDPPQGRTEKLLSSRLRRVKRRNLGKEQLSIDGTVYVAKQIAEGKQLEEIPLVCEIEIRVAPGCSVVLPFTYPLRQGRPLISPRLVAYLKRKGVRF